MNTGKLAMHRGKNRKFPQIRNCSETYRRQKQQPKSPSPHKHLLIPLSLSLSHTLSLSLPSLSLSHTHRRTHTLCLFFSTVPEAESEGRRGWGTAICSNLVRVIRTAYCNHSEKDCWCIAALCNASHMILLCIGVRRKTGGSNYYIL